MGMENMGSRQGMEPAAHQVPGASPEGGTGAAGEAGGAEGPGGADGSGGTSRTEGTGEATGVAEPRAVEPRAAAPGGSGPHDGAAARGGAEERTGHDAAHLGSSGSPGGPGGPSDPRGRREADGGGGEGEGDNGGIAALSLPARIFVAIAVAVVAVAVAFHVAMVFLQTAPDNTVSKQHAEVVDAYVYPEFERNWKLFAPNPLQQNVAVHARATVAKDDGGVETTGWVNLTAMDGAAIRGNPAPSHTQQNELRRGWEFYTSYHDDKSRPIGLRGQLSEQYMKRIVMLRFGPELNGGSVERIQLRSATTPVAAPEWSQERTDVKTQYRVQPWWQVTSADLPGGGK